MHREQGVISYTDRLTDGQADLAAVDKLDGRFTEEEVDVISDLIC